ncbi:hypothetical protein HOC14_02275 [bacterium]|jgi:hypothetical protein|nr:hypothetical protein [bacterium]
MHLIISNQQITGGSMSFRKRINEELAKLSTTDLEQCPVTNKIEDDEVLLGEMDDEQRRLLFLRNHYAHEAEELRTTHREFHNEDAPADDKKSEHKQRHDTLLTSIRMNDLITGYLNDAMWASIQYQTFEQMSDLDSTAIRENWQLVGCKESKKGHHVEVIAIGLGSGFPFSFPG